MLLLLLVGALVAVDRVAATLAGGAVAARIRSSERLPTTPQVTIHGFPFLTQLAAGRYDDVEVSIRDLRRGDLRVSRADVHLHGVEVSASDALARRVRTVPVGSATGSLLLSYADLDAMLAGRGVTVAYAGTDRLRLTGTFSVAGQQVSASGTGTARAGADAVQVTVQSVDVGAGSLVNGALSSVVRNRLTFSIPTADLPFGIRLRSVQVRPDGIAVTATSDGFTLRVP